MCSKSASLEVSIRRYIPIEQQLAHYCMPIYTITYVGPLMLEDVYIPTRDSGGLLFFKNASPKRSPNPYPLLSGYSAPFPEKAAQDVRQDHVSLEITMTP